MVRGLALNLLLFLVLVGGPYVRGHMRAHASWGRYAEFAACVLGASVAPEPGLGMPAGQDVHFASRVLEGQPDWPARCGPSLQALRPEPVTFLLPSVKNAEVDIGRAIDLMQGELDRLAARKGRSERTPRRPLRALATLRAALALHAEAAGVFEVPEAEAIVLDGPVVSIEPTRVPAYSSVDAELTLWGDERSFSFIAADRRQISSITVADGAMMDHRASRPRLLRGVLGPTPSTLVWAMPPERCAKKEKGCAGNSAGVAVAPDPFRSVPKPRWLASHPAGRPDRTLEREGGAVVLAADAGDGSVVVREFDLAVPVEDAAAADAARVAAADAPKGKEEKPPEPPPASPRHVWPEAGPGRALLLRGDGALGALRVVDSPLGEVEGSWQPRDARAQSLGKVEGKTGWAVRCPRAPDVAFAFGSDRALRIGRLGPQGPTVSEPVPVAVRLAVHQRDPRLDRVKLVCDGPSLAALVRTADDALTAVHCDASLQCKASAMVDSVQGFEAVPLDNGHLLIAYAGTGQRAQIRLRRLDSNGPVAGPEEVPSPCWYPSGGLCGVPVLMRAGKRVLLGAREGSFLMMLESSGDASKWRPMRGLRKPAAPAVTPPAG